MLREQMINFLETVVVFLLLTNAVSAFAATYAIWVASSGHKRREFLQAAESKIGAALRRLA